MKSSHHDVVIIGSGLAGSCLAAILARHGQSVLLLEAGAHPRFAVGESVVPEFGARAAILADAYDVPELGEMKSFQSLRQRISLNSGVKRNFSFLHHAEGCEHRSEHTSQFETMTYPLGPDSHIWRADLDAWLTGVAIRYGAAYRDRCPVEDVELADDGVTVLTGDGRRHGARFLVDASGFRSVLSRKLDLAAEVDLKTNTRTLFTHMVGVRRIGEARAGGDRLRVPSPPDQGTLHHLFDGGWFWVIPFDNHALSLNPVCSVGLTLDRDRHPDNDQGAEEEFRSFVRRFPTVARQFDGARTCRSWVKTGRLQHRSKRLAGDRWCLMPHAANFVDALFSGGMPQTILGVHQVAGLLLESLRDDAFDAARFRQLEADTFSNVHAQDTLVHGSFIAFRSHALFNAWFRTWALGNYHSSLGLYRLWLRSIAEGDRSVLSEVSTSPIYRGVNGMGLPRMRALMENGYAVLRRLHEGAATEPETLDGLFALLAGATWAPPQFHLTERDRGHLASFTVFPLIALVLWGKKHAPEDMRETYYGFGPTYFRKLVKAMGSEGARGLGSFWRLVKDAHYARGHA